MTILIKQATLLSPQSKHHLKKRDLLIRNGRIEKIAANLSDKVKTLEAKGCYLSLGWVDLFSDFCDPGFEQKEDLYSGIAAAAFGGYTNVCIIPNTNPSTSNKAQVEYLRNQSKDSIVQIHPIASVGKNNEENGLAEMYDMYHSGAVLFGNGTRSIQSAGLMLKALQYLKTIDGTLIQLPDTRSISEHTLMNEGKMSTQLGMPGNPETAEHIQIQRDIALCEYAESRIHFTGVSTKKSLELILEAKKRGVQASCSVTPYHLVFTDEALSNYNSMFKVNPPLRTEKDKNYLQKAIKEGKIEAVASHHSPQDYDAKQKEFAYTENGMIGLQTVLPMLVQAGLNAEEIAQQLAYGPRAILNLSTSIEEGELASLTLFSTTQKWEYTSANNLSKSDNSPLLNQQIMGKVIATINNQQIRIHEA